MYVGKKSVSVDDEETDRTHRTPPLALPKGREWIVLQIENRVVECKFFKHSSLFIWHADDAD